MSEALGSKTLAWVGFGSQPGMTGLEQTPVLGLQVPAVWQESSAVHVTGVPAQLPLVHTSPVVHRFWSLHVVPSGASGFEQVPVEGEQVPATWHWSLAVHVTGVPLVQAPAKHVSPVKQRSPVLHAVPSGTEGLLHAPVDGLHVPAVVQAPLAVHVTAVPLLHTPPRHVSPVKQRFPVLHDVPSGSDGLLQMPVAGLHTPIVVQGPLARHVTGIPLVQAPAWQVSPLKQRFPVLNTVPLASGGLEQTPVAGEHEPTAWH
jgi:hypothetical protein